MQEHLATSQVSLESLLKIFTVNDNEQHETGFFFKKTCDCSKRERVTDFLSSSDEQGVL